MFARAILGISVFFMVGTSFVSAKEAKPVPGVMFQLRENLLALQPFMASQEKFIAKENDKAIEKNLRGLVDSSKKLDQFHRLKTAGFKVSAKAIEGHLDFTLDVFQTGDKKFAHRMLKASLGGCSSCHTQVEKRTKPLWSINDSELKGSPRDKADFWFSLRQFDKAEVIYDNLIQTYGKKHSSVSILEEAFERKLTICSRVEHDLAACRKTLQAAYRNKSLPQSIRARVSAWTSQVDAIEKAKAPDPTKAKPSEVEAFAKRFIQVAEAESFSRLDDAHLVTFLYVSGLLYRFMNERPTEVTPGTLYWLAKANEHLNQQYFFDYSDLYLKECINQFPASTMATKCFKEFEKRAVLFSTGSSGVNIPEDLRLEIDRLRAKISKASPKKKK